MNLTTTVLVGIVPPLARLLIIVSLTLASATIVAAQSKAIAVTHATLVDGTGAGPRVVTVIVEGERITAIAGNGQDRIPTGATIVGPCGRSDISERHFWPAESQPGAAEPSRSGKPRA